MSSFTGLRRWVVIGVLGAAVFLVIWRMNLFGPVLQHYYRRRDKAEPRRDANMDLEEE